MKLSAETQRMPGGEKLFGLRREAKRHAAFRERGKVWNVRKICVRAKAVSPLRSATAVQNAFGTKEWYGNLFDVMKKLIDIRGRVRK